MFQLAQIREQTYRGTPVWCGTAFKGFSAYKETVVIGGLLGLVLGPGGALLGAFLVGLLGGASTPARWRGGEVAVVDTIVLGRRLSDILHEGLRDPVISLTQDSKKMNARLERKRHVFEGRVIELRATIERAIDQQALGAFLNSPNTNDPAVIEAKIEPVIEAAFGP